MEHQLVDLIKEINLTYPRLGKLIAFSIIAVKAQQFLLVVSPSGCGKSASTTLIGNNSKRVLKFLTITKAALKAFEGELTGFDGVVLMDDIAGGGNEYERTDTLSAFSMLCHEHTFSKHTLMADYEITDFHGSAIINIQPTLLSTVYASPEWEGLLQDKTLRYYHLYRPTAPQKIPPNISIKWGIDIEKVSDNQEHSGKIYERILKIAQIQWSDARALQHLSILLRATASLDSRTIINEDDYNLLDILMRPMILEKYLFSKSGFEDGRTLDKNLCAIIVELASWPRVDIDRIVRDYKVSPSTAYHLVNQMKDWIELKNGQIVPNEILKKILREIGVIK